MFDVLHDAEVGLGYVSAIRRKGNVVWAVGGVWGVPLVMTSDGGRVFRRRKPPEATGLRDVLPITDKHAIVVGEHGALFETKGGDVWTEHETGTKLCLFAVERSLGSMWLAGDESFVLSSDDGVVWRKPALGANGADFGRIQRLSNALGALWFMTFNGKLGVVRKSELELLPVRSENALTGIAFSPRGVGVLVGDKGKIFRSRNRGRTWDAIESGVDVDLEDIAFAGGRFVIVGAEGHVLVSEDGEKFTAIETARDDHLWSVLADGSGVLIGGEAGLILFAPNAAFGEVKARASKKIVPVVVKAEAEARLDEEEIEAASKRWPSATDADLVRKIAVQLHGESRVEEFRRLFPVSYDVFADLARPVEAALQIGDAMYARAGGAVHCIDGNTITTLGGVVAFGASRDRKHVALAFEDRVEIRPHTKFGVPKSVGAIDRLTVFPDGERVLATSARGVFVISTRGVEPLFSEVIDLAQAHAALSTDGRTIVCGDASGAHRIFVVESGAFVLAVEIEPASAAPCVALLHEDDAHACFASSTSVMLLDLSRLPPKKKKSIRIAKDDPRLVIVHGHSIRCAASVSDGFLLGDDVGRVHHVDFAGSFTERFHAGSSAVSALDSTLTGTRSGWLIADATRHWLFLRDHAPLPW